jgi:hypothetical protein
MKYLLEKPVSNKENDYDDDMTDQSSLYVTYNGRGPAVSKGEMKCKEVIEKLTGKSFEKKRPEFLRNRVTDSNLELDCYNEELRLGVEYNGRQHYEYVPYFHSSKDAFYNIKYRDEMKRDLCAKNGVKLITVPYTVGLDEIESYIRARL